MNFRSIFLFSIVLFYTLSTIICQSQIVEPETDTDYYLIHSSGNVIEESFDSRAIIGELSGTNNQYVQFVPDGFGYYWIKIADQQKYMALNGSWNTYFITDSTTDDSKYSFEKVSSSFIRLKCKANGKYLGTDNTTNGSYVYSDKSGSDSKHYWYISEQYTEAPVDTMIYLINPAAKYNNAFEGWGVSLCWWANMCGKWNDEKINEITNWLASADNLNYNIFRYNIGGGDDPLNRNCTPHHMANGKGLRAEMEGFKDSINADYNWTRDSAQRKIMLKIKEKRPDAIFEAFSNSAPYYMTYSGCCAGNISATEDNLKPEFYDEFAHYLVDVCKFYKDSFGIEFKTLEPFNEPVTNYWAANGGQEGCYFSTQSQINFLKQLSPVLKASGLNTIIAASDETSAEQSVTDFKAYITDSIAIDIIGQWNTHTYSATNQARANLRALSTAYNKPLWMSEVGAGGTGISGNLNVAQKLMNDIRYLRPEAWIDWQYVEENNDQWCLLQGDFNAQTYQRVKNYYIRYQFSHYIKAGSHFLSVPNDQMLAALSATGDSLIIVVLNNSSMQVCHQIDLSLFSKIGNNIDATITSETTNNATFSDYNYSNSQLSINLPGYSIATLVLSGVEENNINNELKTDIPYLILSRTANLVMQTTNGSVFLNNFQYGDSTQLWKLTSSGNEYVIKNLAGDYLTDDDSYFAVGSSLINPSNQAFSITNIGDNNYKIISEISGNALDLEGSNNIAGTKIGLYAYGNSPAASHRQWMFMLPPFIIGQNVTDGINELSKSDDVSGVRIIGTNGAIIVLQAPESSSRITIYNLEGVQLLSKCAKGVFTTIPISSGIFLVRSINEETGKIITSKILIK
ncbi:MAG: RICIN domain-containing protein [Marinilabiliaceae bacterium]|nr:RICIN domain-containing protein [Marinilabiliaceae bacterium]